MRRTACLLTVVLGCALFFFTGCNRFSRMVEPLPRPATLLPFLDRSIDDVRALDPETWNRKAVTYSGFRPGQSPEAGVYPDVSEILEDLRLLQEEGFGFIRLSGSSSHGRRVVEVIHANNLDLYVHWSAALEGPDPQNLTGNLRALDEAIELANTFPEIIRSVSVGNGMLAPGASNAMEPSDLVKHIRYMREQIRQPVTVEDSWRAYADSNRALRNVWGQIDFAAIHTFPHWDAASDAWDFRQLDIRATERGPAMMEMPFAYARENFMAARAALDEAGHSIPIVIAGSGWPTAPTDPIAGPAVRNLSRYLAHPVNQASYFDDIMAWAYGSNRNDPGDGFSRPVAAFFFSAFDEPWRNDTGSSGLWTAGREPKYVLSGDGYNASDAAYYDTGDE